MFDNLSFRSRLLLWIMPILLLGLLLLTDVVMPQLKRVRLKRKPAASPIRSLPKPYLKMFRRCWAYLYMEQLGQVF